VALEGGHYRPGAPIVDAGQIADLGDFYRKVWRCGEAGVEVPIEIIRDGRALGLRINSPIGPDS